MVASPSGGGKTMNIRAAFVMLALAFVTCGLVRAQEERIEPVAPSAFVRELLPLADPRPTPGPGLADPRPTPKPPLADPRPTP